MVIEAVAAVMAGVMSHSVSLVAFGADSVIELVAGGALLYRLYVEANESGWKRVERAERAASWIVGIALLALAAYIVVSSVVSLFMQSRPALRPTWPRPSPLKAKGTRFGVPRTNDATKATRLAATAKELDGFLRLTFGLQAGETVRPVGQEAQGQ
ncbi:MAG: hypothetical protein ABSG63_14460 [Spirochaetia bacterium]|jgi:divalent metal cation (Fe/Co/Zn/Cd) transporter